MRIVVVVGDAEANPSHRFIQSAIQPDPVVRAQTGRLERPAILRSLQPLLDTSPGFDPFSCAPRPGDRFAGDRHQKGTGSGDEPHATSRATLHFREPCEKIRKPPYR